MALNVDYSPVGAMGSLSAAAGYGQGQTMANQQMIQLQNNLAQQTQASQDAQLRWQSFSLQKAYAERQAAERSRTPAADHIAERLNLETAQRQAERHVIKAHLDGMLAKGQISDDQYQQAMAGVLADSKELTAQAILQGNKPDPMQKPQFTARVQMLRDQRATLHNELRQIHTARASVLTPADALAEGKTREKEIQKEMATNVAEEMGILTGPEKTAAPAGTLTLNGKTVAGQAPGSLSIRPAGQAPSASPTVPAGFPDPSVAGEGSTATGSQGNVWVVKDKQWVPKNQGATTPQVTVPRRESNLGGITPAWQAAHPSSPQIDNPYLDAQGNAMVW